MAPPVRGDLAASVSVRRGQAQASLGGGRGGGGRGGGGRVGGGRVGGRGRGGRGRGGRGRGCGVTPPINLRKSQKQVGRNFVDDSSANKTYIPKLVNIVMYCLDNREKHEFINPTMLEVLKTMDEQDKVDHERINAQRRQQRKVTL